MFKILAINPGSTSTKIAVYNDSEELFSKNLVHSEDTIAKFASVSDQYDFRKNVILESLSQQGIDISEIDAVVGRGGIINPVKSGAYAVNDKLIYRLNNSKTEHVSNLGGILAKEIADQAGSIAMIYDSIALDEMIDLARITGVPGIERPSLSHALNMRAAAHVAAEAMGGKYHNYNIIVAHLGGGITLSIHNHGQVVDVISDDEGPMSPERAGAIPTRWLIEMIFDEGLDKESSNKILRGNAGLKAYLGTSDAILIEKMILDGDEKAKICYEAMAYQTAKYIGQLATVTKGKVDNIVLTGGIAYSKMLTELIKERVEFIAPVMIIPGENEMRSLALGALRVLQGEETVHEYDDAIREKLF